MTGISGGLAAAGAAVSIGTGIAGVAGGSGGTTGPQGTYIPPSVTQAEANKLNASTLDLINRSIRKQNRYQRRLERKRHAEARADISWFRGQIDRAAEAADPYINERRKYIEKMSALMDDPTSFLEKSPEYRARMAGGLEALTSQMASRGLLGSGNIAIESQALGAREASTQLGKDYERLAKLSGLTDAQLGAAADIRAGSRVPFLGDYRAQFEAERFHPAQGEQGQILAPGAQIVDPQRQGIADIAAGFGNLKGDFKPGGALYRPDPTLGRATGSFVNDQGFIVSL